MVDKKSFETSIHVDYRHVAKKVDEIPRNDDFGRSLLDIDRIVRDLSAASLRSDHIGWIGRMKWSVSVVDEGALQITLTGPDGQVFGFNVRRSERSEQALCDAASGIQDFVVECLRVGLPAVPGTERPARALIVGGQAKWCDSRTSWECRIGAYSQQGGQSDSSG